MKQTLDLSRSKRPIMEPDAKDTTYLHSQIATIGEDMLALADIYEILNTSDVYLQTLALSKERLFQIMERSLLIPLNANTLGEHQEIRGQMKERIRLTKELEGIKLAHENKKSVKERFTKLLTKLSEKLKGT